MRRIARRIFHVQHGMLWRMLWMWICGQGVIGPHEAVFRRWCQDYFKGAHIVYADSGRSVLFATLSALALPEGSEVITSVYEDRSVVQTLEACKLRPRFVDIDCDTHAMNQADITAAISERTSAIVLVYLFGNAVEYDTVRSYARKRGIVIIEDCAHAMGTRCDESPAGVHADVAFFSFNATKPFMSYGGGMGITRDAMLAKKIETIISSWPYPGAMHMVKRVCMVACMQFFLTGWRFDWGGYPCLCVARFLRFNPRVLYDRYIRKRIRKDTCRCRYINMQAYAGMRHLDRMQKDVAQRCHNAILFESLLNAQIPRLLHTKGSNYYFYVLFARDRERVQQALLRRGIDTGDHLMRNCVREAIICDGGFPHTERVVHESVQIPLYETLSEDDVRYIASCVNEVMREEKE